MSANLAKRSVRALLGEPLEWADELARALPGRLGRLARAATARLRGASLGARVTLEPGFVLTGGDRVRVGLSFSADRGSAVHAHGGGRVTVGDRVSLNRNVLLDAANGGAIEIGSDVMIGPNVVVRASNHEHADAARPIREQGHRPGTIVVEDGVWIAANAVVLPDVRIGAHSIVAAGAVVSKDLPAYSIAAGVPAKVIRERRANGGR